MKIKDFLNGKCNLECTITIRNCFVKASETNKTPPTQSNQRAQKFYCSKQAYLEVSLIMPGISTVLFCIM